VKFILIGKGRMGAMITESAISAGDEIVASFDVDNIDELTGLGKVADCVIDFSNPAALPYVCEYVRRTGTALVSGTTGLSAEQLEAINSLGNAAPVMWSANYSLGVAVFVRALEAVADTLMADFDVEITETHHNQKVDAPSGTAKLLLRAIDPSGEYSPVCGRQGICGPRDKKEIGLHSLRGGTEAGIHTVHFFGDSETFEITHRAANRKIFVNGALKMARMLPAKANGVYDLQKILFGGN
jgi:4-hydroxy-tetrahydrodipicolinate reductase